MIEVRSLFLYLSLVPISAICVSASSCQKDIPEEPEIAVCTPIFEEGLAPYTSCKSDINPDDPAKQFRVPLDEFLKGKPIMAPVEDYMKKLKWAEEVKKWGEKNCKPQAVDN